MMYIEVPTTNKNIFRITSPTRNVKFYLINIIMVRLGQ